MIHRFFFLFPAFLLLQNCGDCQVQPARKSSSGYSTKTPNPDGTGKVYLGREIAHVMDSGGGLWLERSTRQQEEDVSIAIALMRLHPNMMVADIGAGTGYYTFRIAQKLPKGKVYAVEIQAPFIRALKARIKESNAANVLVARGTEQDPNLPYNSIDLAIMVDVYHELAYPKEMLQALYKVLKPSGKILLLEYRAEDPSIPIKALHKMSVAQATKELEASGYKLERKENGLPIQHFLLFAKQ